MATNPQARVLELLKKFNDGKIVCIQTLIDEAQDYQDGLWWNNNKKEPMTRRNIDRDINTIRKYFPDQIEIIKNSYGKLPCFKAITNNLFANFIQEDTLAFIIQIYNIAQQTNVLESLNIEEVDKKLISKKLKDKTECYRFISKPFETKLNDSKIFKKLEKAIKYKQYATVKYLETKGIVKYLIKPYKILFMNENFYLACENSNVKYPFIMFRIVNIENVVIEKSTYHINFDILEFIEEIQTPFLFYKKDYKKYMIDVEVKIDALKAKYFKLKNHLPSQKLVQEFEDGSLICSFRVTNEREIENLIKKWIPFIEVLSPLSLKNKINSDLKKYLKKSKRL